MSHKHAMLEQQCHQPHLKEHHDQPRLHVGCSHMYSKPPHSHLDMNRVITIHNFVIDYSISNGSVQVESVKTEESKTFET